MMSVKHNDKCHTSKCVSVHIYKDWKRAFSVSFLNKGSLLFSYYKNSQTEGHLEKTIKSIDNKLS